MRQIKHVCSAVEVSEGQRGSLSANRPTELGSPNNGQQGKDGDREDSLGNVRKREPCGPYSVTEAPLCVSQKLLQSLPKSPVSQAVCIMNYPKGFSLEELKITFTVCACALPSPSADLTTCKGSAWVVPGCAYLKNNR